MRSPGYRGLATASPRQGPGDMDAESSKGCGPVLRTALRWGIPVAGIAAMASLTGSPGSLGPFLTPAILFAIPAVGWSERRIHIHMDRGESIGWSPILVAGASSLFLMGSTGLFFMLDSALSHGAEPRGLYLTKCLFVALTALLYPLADLLLLRSSRLPHRTGVSGNPIPDLAVRVLILSAAAFLLVRIVGPPLNAAMRLDHRRIAVALVSRGADVNRVDRYGATPLWYALSRVDGTMARLLLERGARLDESTAGWGLARAVEQKDPEILTLLLRSGAGADSPYMGATPLLRACQQKDGTMVRLLLQAGADPLRVARYPNMPYDGQTPLDAARQSGDAEIIGLLSDPVPGS